VNEFSITLLLFQADIFDRVSPLLFLFIRKLFKKGYLGNEKKIANTNAIIPVSSRGAKKIPSLAIARNEVTKQSHKKSCRGLIHQTRTLLYEIATLPSVARNDIVKIYIEFILG